jgi:microcystin-dependent protein
MGLETGTYISDLVTSNPINSDLETQGAAHLRLIKTVLQNTFPGAARAVGVDRTSSRSASFTVMPADAKTTFLITTTAGIVNMVLPTLTSSDAGWECTVCKVTTDVNPILVAPPTGVMVSGNVSGLSATRRCIPYVKSRIWWTGSFFVCERAITPPVGSCLEFHGPTLPVGYEWPNGQVLPVGNYPDYNAVIGASGTYDRRQLIAAGSNLGGPNPGRIAGNSGINGGLVGSVGGAEVVTLQVSQMPSHNHSAVIFDPQHSHVETGTQVQGLQPGGAGINTAVPNGASTSPASTGVRVSDGAGDLDVTALQGGNGFHQNMPPTIIMNFILVVE